MIRSLIEITWRDSATSNSFPYAKIECARFKGTDTSVFLDQMSIECPIYAAVEIFRSIQKGENALAITMRGAQETKGNTAEAMRVSDGRRPTVVECPKPAAPQERKDAICDLLPREIPQGMCIKGKAAHYLSREVVRSATITLCKDLSEGVYDHHASFFRKTSHHRSNKRHQLRTQRPNTPHHRR